MYATDVFVGWLDGFRTVTNFVGFAVKVVTGCVLWTLFPGANVFFTVFCVFSDVPLVVGLFFCTFVLCDDGRFVVPYDVDDGLVEDGFGFCFCLVNLVVVVFGGTVPLVVIDADTLFEIGFLLVV